MFKLASLGGGCGGGGNGGTGGASFSDMDGI